MTAPKTGAICIPHATGSRRTAALANEIAAGTGQPCHIINVVQITAADWAALDAAPAIIFGSPTYMGGISAAYAQFIEDCAARWDNGAWRDKIAAGFTTAVHPSGDKLATLQRLAVFAGQMGMLWIGPADIGAPVFADRPGLNSDGSWLGLMATDPAKDATAPDQSALLRAGDAETARRFGARIAGAVARWG